MIKSYYNLRQDLSPESDRNPTQLLQLCGKISVGITPQGSRRTLGKCVYGKQHRGFESHSLRHWWLLKFHPFIYRR